MILPKSWANKFTITEIAAKRALCGLEITNYMKSILCDNKYSSQALTGSSTRFHYWLTNMTQ